MAFIPGEPCAKELPLLHLVVSRDGDPIIQAVPGGSRCCGTENWWAMTIFLWLSVHLLLRDSCEQCKTWLISFFSLCFELWTHVSQHWPVPFILVELSSYGNNKSYIFTILTSMVCVVTYCECGLWCVLVCVHMCICIYHTAGLSCCCLVAKQQVQ